MSDTTITWEMVRDELKHEKDLTFDEALDRAALKARRARLESDYFELWGPILEEGEVSAPTQKRSGT
jgi:hypothetical protein